MSFMQVAPDSLSCGKIYAVPICIQDGDQGGSEEPHPQAGTPAYLDVRRGERRSTPASGYPEGIHLKANRYKISAHRSGIVYKYRGLSHVSTDEKMHRSSRSLSHCHGDILRRSDHSTSSSVRPGLAATVLSEG